MRGSSEKKLTLPCLLCGLRTRGKARQGGAPGCADLRVDDEGSACSPGSGCTHGVSDAGSFERAFFTTVTTGWRNEEIIPDRLVYLLDHGYTPRGLSWRRLNVEVGTAMGPMMRELARTPSIRP